MKNSIIILLAGALLLMLASCADKKKDAANRPVEIVETVASADSTIYGRCGDGTTMNSLELITDKGDVMNILLEGADTCSVVQGGLLAGDRLAVIAVKDENGELFARSVLNITSLLGKWTSIDRTFTIEDGGVVNGDNTEPNPYIEWKINNGNLVLSSDTFSVYSLGPDSLLLENKNGIYAYRRVVKK